MPEMSVARDGVVARLGTAVDWFKSRERPLLIAGALLQLAVLAGMIAVRSIPFVGGRTVLLRVQPVDPRDLFRGDYVILGYEFNRIPTEGIPGLPPPKLPNNWSQFAGRTVYLSLIPDADGVHYRADRYRTTPPADGIFLRGTIAGSNRIDFGIDRFYVQEGKGHQYEEAVRKGLLWAEIVISPDGQGMVRSLQIENPGRN